MTQLTFPQWLTNNNPLKAHCLAMCMLALTAALFTSPSIAKEQAQPALPKATLLIDGKKLYTEIAHTPQQRYMGLSFRTELAENDAMLFVYTHEQPLIFVMRNTLIPLSIAFISKDLRITEILDMSVGDTQNFPSKKNAQYALEVNLGWFERNGISVGSQVVVQ